MTYRDIPVLRSKGFEAGASGHTWFGKDKDGNEWQATDRENGMLVFRGPDGTFVPMTEETFHNTFDYKTMRDKLNFLLSGGF